MSSEYRNRSRHDTCILVSGSALQPSFQLCCCEDSSGLWHPFLSFPWHLQMHGRIWSRSQCCHYSRPSRRYLCCPCHSLSSLDRRNRTLILLGYRPWWWQIQRQLRRWRKQRPIPGYFGGGPGQRGCGLCPGCCSSSDAGGTDAGTLLSTQPRPGQWHASRLGVGGTADAGGSPDLAHCHTSPWRSHLSLSCTTMKSWPQGWARSRAEGARARFHREGRSY